MLRRGRVESEKAGGRIGVLVARRRKRKTREQVEKEEVESIAPPFSFVKTLVDSGADVCLDVSFEEFRRFIESIVTRSARENGLARVATRREPSKG